MAHTINGFKEDDELRGRTAIARAQAREFPKIAARLEKLTQIGCEISTQDAHKYKLVGRWAQELLDKNAPLERQMGRRESRDADRLHNLIVAIAIILKTTTGASSNRIYNRAIPSILKGMRKAFPETLPKRGYSDPERRFTELIKRARVTSRKSSEDILQVWRDRLLAWDDRFFPRG